MLESEWSRIGELRCLCVKGDGIEGMLTGPDQACERIVRMVNSHADLLAAIEAVASDYGISLSVAPGTELTGPDLHSTAIRMVRVAWAKAKGQQA